MCIEFVLEMYLDTLNIVLGKRDGWSNILTMILIILNINLVKIIQVASLLILFLGVLMTTIPLHMQKLTSYLISSSHLSLSLSTQETISSLLSKTLITDVGRLLLGSSACLLLPSTLGYVGAVRESRLLLVLVRLCGVYHMYSCIIMDSTSHPSWYSGDWSLSSSSSFQLSSYPYTVLHHGWEEWAWLSIEERRKRWTWYHLYGTVSWQI